MIPVDSALPRLRAIEITPLEEQSHEAMYLLSDRTRVAPHSLAVSAAGCFVLMFLDGRSTIRDVQAACVKRHGVSLPTEHIVSLIEALDQALLLDTPRFEAAQHARRAAYRAAQVRDNRARWPLAPQLREELRLVLDSDRGPGALPAPLGLIAPHLDYARGLPCYAEAYAALPDPPPYERYVILGTNHFGESGSLVATRKHFLTPLGLCQTDAAFLEALERRLGSDLCADELDHDQEHSIELQVHLLQERVSGDFSIVPVLVPDPSAPGSDGSPCAAWAQLDAFAEALREKLAADGRPTLIIASADLSHVGQRFGDEPPTTPEFLARIASHDRGLLELLTARREREFVRRVADGQNFSRICSVGCVYAALRALPGARCDLLRYHQAVDMPAETHVTCCAARLLPAS